MASCARARTATNSASGPWGVWASATIRSRSAGVCGSATVASAPISAAIRRAASGASGPETVTSALSCPGIPKPGVTANRPTGNGPQCSAWISATRVRSSTPVPISARAPDRLSSAGWKRNTTVPARCRRSRARTCATPRATVVWTSCPQRWAGAGPPPTMSLGGTASMSARYATVRPGRAPRRTATTPWPPTPVVTASPAARSFRATTPAVRCSCPGPSGCRWRSRRSSISPRFRRATSASTAPCATGCPRPTATALPDASHMAPAPVPAAPASNVRRARARSMERSTVPPS